MIDAASVDLLKVAAFVAVAFINRQAIVLLLAHVCCELLFLLPLTDFWFNLAAATLYAAAATVFIKLKSQLRYAMLCMSGLYYLGAIDAFLFPSTETMYYNSIAYLVSAVDLYALVILCKGGQQYVGTTSPSYRGFFRLQLFS
jgi:hypothetical protein